MTTLIFEDGLTWGPLIDFYPAITKIFDMRCTSCNASNVFVAQSIQAGHVNATHISIWLRCGSCLTGALLWDGAVAPWDNPTAAYLPAPLTP